jgi:hypothetical protein
MKYLFPLFISAFFFFVSCSDPSGNNLPAASGKTGDIFLVMDSLQWEGPLGKVLDSLFSAEMEGLPRKESIYHMRWIDPRKMNYVLKQRRNLIYAVTLDQRSVGASQIRKTFTPESLEKIKSNPDLFSQNTQHLFAKNQEVLFLFGNTEKELIKKIRTYGTKLVQHFDESERERLTAALFKSKQSKGIPDILRKKYNCEIKVPFGFQLVANDSNFFWLRQINPYDDKDIFITRKKYTSQEQFKPDSLIAWRNQICRYNIFEDPEKIETYLVTETSIPYKPVITQEITFNKKFAVEMRGLWKTNNLTMGGPFISFSLVDEDLGMMYYIEGFTYSPSKDQREIIRELETILYTFRTSGELAQATK